MQQALAEEETGRVEGRILWRDAPLQHRPVKIVLETYTGFSLAAVKQRLATQEDPGESDRIELETTTDSQGRYAFPNAPPGTYRLYWQPDADTGWVHRLRDKPDFEVVPGGRTVADVPDDDKRENMRGDDHDK